ncbi:MAG: putative acetyltransferase [Candidatus Saccharibacteria bacterium]|nr:putative acetyltransferase [Candidatus Saccharibacteria bacterium]
MESDLAVERLRSYSPQDAAEIGQLLHILSPKFPNAPPSDDLLRAIIDSPLCEQLVARLDGKIVGIATLSTTVGVGVGHKAYLEDFVVNPVLQGHGVGTAIWNEITIWCREKNIKLHFTSNAKREEAHRFYLKHGANVYDTVVFNYDPLD